MYTIDTHTHTKSGEEIDTHRKINRPSPTVCMILDHTPLKGGREKKKG